MDINIVTIDKFNINEIKFSKLINKKKILIGYETNGDLHLLTPFFLNNLNLSNQSQYLKLNFEPMLGPIEKYYLVIESIENAIKHHINEINNGYSLQSILKKEIIDIFDDTTINDSDNNLTYMYVKLLSESKYYNLNSIECNINQLINGWKFKSIIKIDSIWINHQTKKYGLTIKLIQLKIYQPIEQIRCLIDNDVQYISRIEPPKNIEINKKAYESITITDSSNIINSSNIEQKIERNKSFILPNPLELLKIRNTLKKVL